MSVRGLQRPVRPLVLLFVLLLLQDCRSHQSPPAPPLPPAISLIPVAGGFSLPVGITHAGDGSGRLFIVEQGGLVRIVKNGAVYPAPFLDVSSRLKSGTGEQGLLGLAFHRTMVQHIPTFTRTTRAPRGRRHGDIAIHCVHRP